MNFTEQAHVFGPGDLLGILSLPETSPNHAVIVVVGGPQYRAGSHRQFVQLCRAIASRGHAAFRFDYTGMGDSPGPLTDFLSVSTDIAAAIDFVEQQIPGIKNISLWGLCDGASASLLYWHSTRDSRVKGLCLANPWVRSAVSQAQTQVKHYYTQRLRQPEFWRKLFSGKVARSAAIELIRSVRTMLQKSGDREISRDTPNQTSSFQSRMAEAWHHFPGRILLLLSDTDFTAKEFLESVQNHRQWANAMKREHLTRHDLIDADHTFSNMKARLSAENLTCDWLDQR